MRRNYKKGLVLLLLLPALNYAQVGVNTTSPSASLEVEASNITTPLNTDGFLIPRINAFPATNPGADQNAMLVYLNVVSGANPIGFYYWNNATTTWLPFGGSSSNAWELTGNSGTVNGTNFLGTTDNQGLDFRTNNVIRARITTKGQIEILNTGNSIFLGEGAGAADDLANRNNIFVGKDSGANISTGAAGANDGAYNVGIGGNTLNAATTARINVAFGYGALENLITGFANTALGFGSLDRATTASDNVSIGQGALTSATGTVDRNVIIGQNAFSASVSALENVAIGNYSGAFNNGEHNVFVGVNSDRNNSAAGNRNTIIGANAGKSSGGVSSLTGRVMIGYEAGLNVFGNNKLYIENSSSVTPLVYGEFDNDIVRIGGQLQIGSSDDATAGSIYAFPTSDGTAGQVLTTDGAGVVSWGTGGSSSDSDWFAQGTTASPTAITDNIFTNGNVGIGDSTPDANLDIESEGDAIIILNADTDNANEADNPGLQMIQDGGFIRANIQLGGNIGASYPSSGQNDLLIYTTTNASDIQFAPNNALALTLGVNSQARLNAYTTATSFTGTATSLLGVDAAGNIIQEPLSSGGADTQDLSIVDATGTISLVDGGSVNVSTIADADADTKIQVEESADEDIIRLDLAGTETVTFEGARINTKNTGFATFLGDGAGASGTLGAITRTTFIGFEAGNTVTSGIWNTAVGYQALKGNITGGSNTMVGYQSGFNTTTSDNVGMGRWSLRNNTTNAAGAGSNVSIGTSSSSYSFGRRNVAIGNSTMGVSNSGGQFLEGNVVVGNGAGFAFRDNKGTIAIGEDTLDFLENGNYNIAIGHQAGRRINNGSENNIMIGRQVGGNSNNVADKRTFKNSIVIGNNAGLLENEGAEDRLYIEQSGSRTPLIGGDFANDRVGININMTTAGAAVGVAPTALTHTLTVGGDVFASGDFVTPTNTYPDYVFEDYFTGNSLINKDYKFMTLNEAIRFVEKNGHLPNVKSYKEVEADKMQIDLGATSIKNLEKIEENFLYIKEINEKNEALEKENKNLKSRTKKLEENNKSLTERLDRLEEMLLKMKK